MAVFLFEYLILVKTAAGCLHIFIGQPYSFGIAYYSFCPLPLDYLFVRKS